MSNLRYFCAVVFFASGLLILWFGLSSGSPDSAILGLLGVAVAVGIALPQHGVVRYLCAAIFLANAAMILQSAVSSGSPLWLLAAALFLAAAIGLVRRQRWVRFAAVIAGVLEVGSWAIVVLDVPSYADVTIISLIPGLLFSAVWIWCVLTVFRLSKPTAPAQAI